MSVKFFKGRAGIVTAVIAVILTLYYFKVDILQQLDLKFIDAKFRLRGEVKPGDDITIVEIDKKSINEIGKWPWDRDKIAQLIQMLSRGGARVIGLDLLFASPNPKAEDDHELIEEIRKSGNAVLSHYFSLRPEHQAFQSREEFEAALRSIYPFRYTLITNIEGDNSSPNVIKASGAEVNIPAIAAEMAGSGYYNVLLDRDGTIRRIPLIVRAEGNYYPCFAVSVLKAYYRVENLGAVFAGAYPLSITVGSLSVPTDEMGQLYLNYYGPGQSFTAYPAWKAFAGKIPEASIRDKIVLVGGSSIGDFESCISPFATAMPSMLIQATCIDNMLHGRYLVESLGSIALTILAIIAFPVLLGLFLPRKGKAVFGLCLAVLFTVVFLLIGFYLFVARNTISSTVYPLIAISSAYLGISTHTSIIRERRASQLRKSVSEMGMAISRVLDLDRLLPRVLSSMIQASGATRGMLLTRGEKGHGGPGLSIKCHKGMPMKECESGDFAHWKKVIDMVSSDNRSIVVKDVRKKKSGALPKSGKGARHESVLCIPLLHDKDLLGIVYMESKNDMADFWAEDVAIIDSLASQAAIAIENARLYRDIQIEVRRRNNLQRYLSPSLVEQVIDGTRELNLGGEIKEVTVLFSDIRSFTTLSEELPPNEVVGMLNEYFHEMTKVTFRNEGTIDKFVGDALIVVFGAAVRQQDDPLRAVRTAIEMQSALGALNERWRSQGRRTFQIGIGINTGDVLYGNVGSEQQMELTVIGDAVNLASRLADIAGGGEILVSGFTWKAIEGSAHGELMPPVRIKGKAEPVEVHKIRSA